jgi:hypothetical protein
MAVGEEMLMSRKLSSGVAILAFLSLSMAVPVQACVTSPPATPSGVLLDLSRWVSAGLADLLAKDGAGFDPTGAKHQVTHGAPGAGKQAGKGAGQAR